MEGPILELQANPTFWETSRWIPTASPPPTAALAKTAPKTNNNQQ